MRDNAYARVTGHTRMRRGIRACDGDTRWLGAGAHADLENAREQRDRGARGQAQAVHRSSGRIEGPESIDKAARFQDNLQGDCAHGRCESADGAGGDGARATRRRWGRSCQRRSTPGCCGSCSLVSLALCRRAACCDALSGTDAARGGLRLCDVSASGVLRRVDGKAGGSFPGRVVGASPQCAPDPDRVLRLPIRGAAQAQQGHVLDR
eukprot:3802474-Rhodomonas_salina.3